MDSLITLVPMRRVPFLKRLTLFVAALVPGAAKHLLVLLLAHPFPTLLYERSHNEVAG
jgi:hypothetical protein